MAKREPEKDAENLGGRQGRKAKSRLAICEACLDLIQEGVLQPSAERIAKRAGVSRRLIFNHFADLSELYDAVAEVGMHRYAPLLEHISEDAPIGQRVDRLVEVRANFLEATVLITWALTAQALVGPAIEQAVRVSREGLKRHHQNIQRLFQTELHHLPARDRSEILEAMTAATSPLFWEYLRRSRGIPKTRARSIVRRSLVSLLRDAGVEV